MAIYNGVHDAHPDNPHRDREIRAAATELLTDGLVVYPTDSGYALGCKLDTFFPDEINNLDRIRRIRHLDDDHDFTVICQDFAQLSHHADMNEDTTRMIKAVIPGNYTFILPATDAVPRGVMTSQKRNTARFSIPAHPVTQALLAELGAPIVSTALPLPDHEDPPTHGWELVNLLDNVVDAVIDAGECRTVPNTVIDFSRGKPKIIQEGAGDPTPFKTR
jgi:tRNA threonylcarbamoyl adenosine modification protein (Sua5/YciO/YrdC/YwlC family)